MKQNTEPTRHIDNLWDQLAEALPEATPLLKQLLDPAPTKATPVPRAAREFPFGAHVTVQRFIGKEPVEISGYVSEWDHEKVSITNHPDGTGWTVTHPREHVKVFAGGPR